MGIKSHHKKRSRLEDEAARLPHTIGTNGTFELAAVSTESVTLSFSASVAQIIDTTTWSKPSPDPAGLTWIPGSTAGTGTLLMTDSEIDETPFFRPDNLFYFSTSGAFDHSASLASFCKEPSIRSSAVRSWCGARAH